MRNTVKVLKLNKIKSENRLNKLNIKFIKPFIYKGVREIYWLECFCGKKFKRDLMSVFASNRVSCGCLRKGKNNPKWKGFGEISGNYWNTVRYGAREGVRSRPLEFSITIEYAWKLFLKQERKCALSGIELFFPKDSMRENETLQTASLDRIDSSLGYIPGNVQWVHKKVNIMKQDMSDLEFINWCKAISRNNL